MIKLEAVAVVGGGVRESISAVLEPVCGAFDITDKVWAFILFLELC